MLKRELCAIAVRTPLYWAVLWKNMNEQQFRRSGRAEQHRFCCSARNLYLVQKGIARTIGGMSVDEELVEEAATPGRKDLLGRQLHAKH